MMNVIVYSYFMCKFCRHKPTDENVFLCLTLVIRALKEKVEPEIRTLLPLLLSTGLSKGNGMVHFQRFTSGNYNSYHASGPFRNLELNQILLL